MEAAQAAGQSKKVYKDDVIALSRYLIPFFGNHHSNRIDYPMLEQFEAWRIEKMGKQPKASSIGAHNSALNKVFDEVIERGFINAIQRPELYNRRKDGDRRPDFILSEYRIVARNLREFAKAAGIRNLRK